MKFVNEFRNKELIQKISKLLNSTNKELTFMEVCGSHTMAIQKFGIPDLLPNNIRLISGPGCPVCVTSRGYIDRAIAYSNLDNTIIITYGDLIRVPGSETTLDEQKASGRDIRNVYSIIDAIKIAESNPDKNVIFLAIGFETTIPATAVAIEKAINNNIDNFYIYSAHKIMPPAMESLITKDVKIDGYLAPGHVSTITGSEIYNFIPEKFNIACVVSGFEPLDILESILRLSYQILKNETKVEIQYKRVVNKKGNIKAQEYINKFFELRDDWWRGLNVIPKSGYKLQEKYSKYDAELNFNVNVSELKENTNCICGDILKGIKKPKECKLFGTTCTPSNPIGACMVSNEGACAAYYKYNRK